MNNDTKHLETIEKNHLGHFAFLPRKLGFDVTEINGVTVINCDLKTSMFNIAYGSPKSLKISDTINQIKQVFVNKPFAWWIPPSDYNPKVTKSLLQSGFEIETTEHAMICDFSVNTTIQNKTDLNIKHVTDKYLLGDFLKVLEVYDPYVDEFYKRMNDGLFNVDEKLFVGYVGDKPVTIGILFFREDSASIFSLITNEDARGKGYGTEMMTFFMNFVKESGCKKVTLSATSDSGYRIYERLGFNKIGEFECFEYQG